MMKLLKTPLALLVPSVCLCLFACTRKPTVAENEFLIQGKLENVPDSTIIELRRTEGRLLNLVATDTLVQGEFAFRDTISSGVRELHLMVGGRSRGFANTWTNVWVAPGAYIRVTGEDKLIRTWKVESRLPEQAEENRFNEAAFPERRQVLEYSVEEQDLILLLMGEHADQEELQKRDWEQIDSIRKLAKPLDLRIERKELDYLKTAPVSPIWLKKYMLYATFLQWNPKHPYISDIKALYQRMSDADKATEEGKVITEYMQIGPAVHVGDRMVDGDLYDREGKKHHLAEFEGKYILLDFWSQGCGPCVQSLPELEEISRMYEGKLAVVSISSDPEKSWKSFLEEKKLGGIQWNELRRGSTGLAARYQVVGIPHYVLISPEGIIRDMWSGYGPGSLKAKMAEHLKS